MAMLHQIPFEWHDAYADVYRLPNGGTVSGRVVEIARQKERERKEAAKGYDPRNYVGRKT